jgi:anaerobic ribonucleoside-triphosphate reductase activating protein
MRYSQIIPFDVCNGKGIGLSLFVQGCKFHCKGCFNSETWNFDGGKEWNEEIKNKFFELINRPYIKRVSILGGEPLADENISEIYNLISEIKERFPDKDIWLYTGYEWDEMIMESNKRHYIISECDIVIDGRYIEEQRDITLPFRGSKNQRVIDVKKSLEKNEIVLYEE